MILDRGAMTTEELISLGPDLTSAINLRRVRFLIAGNRMLKDSMTMSNDPAVTVLSNLIRYMYQEAEKLQNLPHDHSASLPELTELVLVLHSLVITHPGIILEHEPRRFVSNIILLMQTRNYDLTLNCLHLLKALFTHCLPDAQSSLREVSRDILAVTADLFYEPKLIKLLIMSMSKNMVVKELILTILAGLTCSGEKTTAAVASVGQLDSYCSIISLSDAASSERTCFHTLTCYYNLLTMTGGDEDCPENVSELRLRLIDCPESLEVLTQLHSAVHSVRVRCMALSLLLRLFISRPSRMDELQLSFLPRLLHGFVRLAELMSQSASCLGELGRLAFRDMAVCVHSASLPVVTLAVHCNRLCALLDRIHPPDEEWRILVHSLLAAFALRLESARLHVASLSTSQRLLKDFSCESPQRRLHSDMVFLLALSRSVEVMRSLLVDHPSLVDTALTVVQRARSAGDVETLSVAIKLLTNLSVPVAGSLHARLVEKQVARTMAEIAKARVELPLRARLYALATLTNLSLAPDATDVAASMGDSSERTPGACVTLKGPLSTSALVDLLEEANDLTSAQERQQLSACVAQLTRNLARNSVDDTFEDDEDEDEDEEEKEDSQEQLQRLLLYIINSQLTSFGTEAKEAALMAISSLAASQRMSLMLLLSADWANQLVNNFIREPYSSSCQTAAMLAISYLDALELPWRRRVRQEVESVEVENAIKSEGALFLRKKFLQESRDMEMAAMSGSESS